MGAEITERTVAQEKRRNGERTEKTEKLKRLIEDELSSPFDLRYSVSPVSPCPPHPPFPGRVLRILRSLAVSSASSVPYLVTARGCCPADMVPTTDARWAAKIVASAWTLSDASPPPRISADSAPMQPSGARIGTTIAPLDEPARARTICSWPVRYAVDAALSPDRKTVGMRAMICGL